MVAVIQRRTCKIDFDAGSGVPKLLARLLALRGVQSPVECDYAMHHLLHYKDLLHIEQAVTWLYEALSSQQHVVVIGDFDADGATSTALFVSAFKALGGQRVDYLVPNRFEYGYGLTPEIVAVALERYQPDLIVTVDNGTTSHAGVAAATEAGVRVLITDHHLPGKTLPDQACIVNPNQQGDVFPSKHLAGVGVIFYVILALRAKLRDSGWFLQQGLKEPAMSPLLDLVALGTVADVVPLDHNNRILVQQGLLRMRAGLARPGIAALLRIASKGVTYLTASDLGFSVAPRLNAAGRLEDMSLGIACLLSQDAKEADAMAQRLDALNRERRDIEVSMHEQASQALAELSWSDRLPYGLCLFNPDWHQGVIGILAARVKEQWHRPVIVLTEVAPGELKGSCRSVSGVHIRDVLAAIAARYPTMLTKFGGHAMAAGLSLARSDYEVFSCAFDDEVRKHLTYDAMQRVIYTDGELEPVDITLDMAKLLAQSSPWGQHFPEPLFDGEFMLVQQYLVGKNHLKMLLQPVGGEPCLDAIAFRVDLKHWPNHRCSKVYVVYRLSCQVYQGLSRLQLIVEHLKALVVA